MRRFLVRAWFALACVAASASAQTDSDLVRARRLYSQGLTQEAASDWAGALGTFEDVARIKLTPQVRFHVARCKEHLGRLNEALGGYRMAEYDASQGGKKEKEIVEQARAAREDLEARIPKLTIVRGKNADAAKIELDEVVLGDAQLGQPISVDPGRHSVVGVLPGGKRVKQQVDVAERDNRRVELDVPDEAVPEPAAAPTSSSPSPAPAPPPTKTSLPEPEPDTAPAAKPASSAAPWIVGGVGVASLVASGVFYSLRQSEEKKLDDGCLGRTCPDTLQSAQSRGQTYSALAGVTLGVGIAGVAASALMLLGRSSESPKPVPAAALQIDRRSLGLSWAGHF